MSDREDGSGPATPVRLVDPGQRPLPTQEQVASTFRQLADSYSFERAAANRERTWQRIELKGSLKRRGLVAPRARARLRWAGWSLAAVAALSLTLFAVLPDRPIEYALEGGNVEQGWVVTAKQLAHLSFSDGSELRLGEDSALSVDALGPHSALSRLARGTVHIAVEHHDDTKWTFLAGPYEVRVEGTAFDLSWRSEQLEVKMHEGQVRVVGPNRREWVLKKGDDLVVPPQDAPVRLAAEQPHPEAEVAVPGLAEAESAPEALEGEVAAAPREEGASVTSRGRPAQNWGKLLKQGRFGDVVGEARRLGVEQSLRTRPIVDLEALAQAARYTGEGALAEQSWKSIRARAPGSGAARHSSFFLGRVMEQQGRRGEAIQWFARYREESPSGVYAGQALGRQLVLTSGQGRSSAARELAQTYLDRYPDGPYAQAARGVLGERSASAER